ncbi:VOC family protein [Granulicella sp. WH15]|uniref:VOC family protein n=1 Tax=Granulicella sp. WH15 TaxID=2602070 RepID=UPI0021059F1F|nr:VOC family protein [Granulicella sp. WH15]
MKSNLTPYAMLTVLSFVSVAASARAQQSRPLITGISHISVYSTDSAKSEAFYVKNLGGVKRSDPENAQGVRFYFSPTQFVEVLPLPAEHTISRLDHVAFVTVNADALKAYIGAHGIAVPAKLEKGEDGSLWFDVQDPEGNKVEFVQPPASPAPVNSSTAISNHIIHVGYMVHSRTAEDAFYRTVLGFRPYWYGGNNTTVVNWVSQQVPDGTDWIEYMMAQGPETKGIPSTMEAAQLGSMDHFSLGVFDMKKTAEILYEGDRIPERASGPKIGRDGKWQYNLFDPDGTRAETMEFKAVVKPCCSDFTASSPTK